MNNTLFEVDGLSAIRGTRQLFHNLQLALNEGDILQIVGGNGCGKTTLIRQLCGFTESENANFHWRDQPCNIEQLADEINYCGHQSGLDNRLSVIANLKLMLQMFGDDKSTGNNSQSLVEVLSTIRLESQQQLLVSKLSAGQTKQLSLARLLIARRPLWIVDEPFSALDNDAVELWSNLFKQFAEGGGAIIFTSHQSSHLESTKSLNLSDFGGLDG